MAGSWRTFSERFRSGDSADRATFKPQRNLDDDSLWSQGTQDSWIELGPPSRGSVSSSAVDAALLVEAQASRHSPTSLASPNASNDATSGPNLHLVNQKLLGKGDWLWDWSSRPEAIPPKEYRQLNIAPVDAPPSALTTPPNSPQPRVSPALSFRHSKIARSDFFRVEVVFGLVVSNLFTFFMGACLGYYIANNAAKTNYAEAPF